MMETLQRLGDTARTQQDLLNRGIERQRQENQRQENQRQENQRQENRGQIKPDPDAQSGHSSSPSPGQSPPNHQDDVRQDAERQENLRRQLGELMLDFDDRMGTIPPDLGKAERAMRDAAKALQRQFSTGSPNDALQPQTRALQALREAEQSIANAMTQNSGMSQGRQSLGNSQIDPFGRRLGDQEQPSPGYEKIPDKAEMGKAHEVLRELRRRASDPRRPDADRAYIDRLIPQF